jgi:hypothetical protein
MAIEEISPGEQLMGLTSAPQVQPNMQFFFHGLIWPAPDVLSAAAANAGRANVRFRNETMAWIGKVLKPEYVAADLSSRLEAAAAIVDGKDAFLARYRMNDSSVQIIVVQFHVHLVFAPMGDSPLAALHRYLRVDDHGQARRWQGQWQTGSVAGLTFGYQIQGSPDDWRDTVDYLTNDRAVKFSLEKIADHFREMKGFVVKTDAAERNWFNAPE